MSYTLTQIDAITQEQYQPWAKDLRGASVQFEDIIEGRWKKYICGLCWEACYRDPYALKERGSAQRHAGWLHKVSAVRWCRSDKQHGPRTRRVFPLPGLYVIEELEWG